MRHRLSGTNWQGRRWQTPTGLQVLARQINQLYPSPHAADGTVASRNHDAANPFSDHRPWPWSASPATVYAIDWGHSDPVTLRRHLDNIIASRDPRVKYMIHANELVRSYPRTGTVKWQWSPYTGPNPHATHAHISLLRSTAESGREWQLGKEDLVIQKGDTGKQVEKVQRKLIAAKALPATNGDGDPNDDGVFGDVTEAAVKRFQRRVAVDLPVTGVVDWLTGDELDVYVGARELAKKSPKGHVHPHVHEITSPTGPVEPT